MNNKGFTLVELLVSFTLSIIIVIILFQLIISLKDLYMVSGLKTELLTKQNIMTNKIYSDLVDRAVVSIDDCEDSNICVGFTFENGDVKKLIVDETNGTLSYDNYVIKLDNGSYFSNIYIDTVENGLNNGKYNRIFNINVPIYNDVYEYDDFGLDIVYMYDVNSVSNTSTTKYNYEEE